MKVSEASRDQSASLVRQVIALNSSDKSKRSKKSKA